jgi:hypothetical protein
VVWGWHASNCRIEKERIGSAAAAAAVSAAEASDSGAGVKKYDINSFLEHFLISYFILGHGLMPGILARAKIVHRLNNQ